MNNFKWQETVRNYLEYCINSKNLSRLSISAYRQDLNEFLCFASNSPPAAAFEPDRIYAYIAHLREDRILKPATVRRRIACLRGYAKWLENRGDIAESPFRRMDLKLRIPKRLPKTLQREQIFRIARHCNTERRRGRSSIDETTTLSIKIMLATGIRVSELTQINIGDVSLNGASIRIYGKGARERTVYTGNKALAVEIGRHIGAQPPLHHDAPLLTNRRGSRMTPQALRLRLRRLSK